MMIEDNNQVDILVVDDVKADLMLLVDILLQNEFRARQAQSAAEALQLISAKIPDLILLDVQMPEVDGFQLCRQLKIDPSTAEIPIIFISGLDNSADILAGFEAGAVDYITKPYNANEVLARVNAHLGLKRLQVALVEKNELVRETLEQSAEIQSQLFASEKMASLGRAVAGIAHELNTPMGLCVTATSYLRDKNKQIRKSFNNKSLTSDDVESFIDTLDESLDIIMTSMNRSTEMVNNFKMVAVDVSSEKLRSFALHDYLSRIVHSLTPELRKTALRVDIIGDDLIIDSYPGALSQVITNIIMNAIIHGYDKGEAGNIVIRTVKDGSNVHLNCSDDGKGMTTESLKNIFEAYYTTREGTGGSGLGTSIIQQLVTETLQGEVSCSSELGVGTMFTITLPIQLSA